ncbi:unnamed protein product, partial [Rotaria sp. Silwood1]
YTGGDTSWKDGTEMSWHYWTQPLSNPLSPIFYRVPASVHAMETYSTYISEGEILGGQAEYIRVSFADINCLLIENDVSDGKAVYLLDFIPTAYHGCQIGNVKQGDVDPRFVVTHYFQINHLSEYYQQPIDEESETLKYFIPFQN